MIAFLIGLWLGFSLGTIMAMFTVMGGGDDDER